MQFHSPWLDFPKPTWPGLKKDLHCEVAIIGAGISGVATLYFLMTNTNKKVVLLEKGSVASGASGHNAGLAVSHIEKPITELVQEFGLEKTRQAYDEIDTGWDMLFEIHKKIGSQDNLSPISSVAMGIALLPSLIDALKSEQIRIQLSKPRSQVLVLDNEEIKGQIPDEYHDLVQYVPQQQILKVLKVVDTSYIAALVRDDLLFARMNSAKFCYEVLHYLSQKYPDRFSLYENTEILQVELHETETTLQHTSGKVQAQDLVLCTNGYNHFPIFDRKVQRKCTKLQQIILPREGFLAAYPGHSSDTFTRGFLHNGKATGNVPYWYVSQAPLPNKGPYICLGGPEYTLSSFPASPELIDQYATESRESMHQFIKHTLNQTPPPFTFFWHGIMGYTSSGLRWVGKDPDHPHLWYNLGCNGIGIIPALAGAKRISRLMKGEILEPSLFDPPDMNN